MTLERRARDVMLCGYYHFRKTRFVHIEVARYVRLLTLFLVGFFGVVAWAWIKEGG